MNQTVKISVCQFKIESNKFKNIDNAKKNLIDSCKHSNIVVLPECFICPYDTKVFKDYAEKIFNPKDKTCLAYNMLLDVSKTFKNVYIFGGTIIEEDERGNLYNTCLVFYDGELIGKYRKINLYKIYLEKHSFCEADVLSQGDLPEIITTIYGKIGIGICYDLRFSELTKYYQQNDCVMVIYPGSFNRITGPKHWQILQQVRALDNQLFIVSCSSACNFGSSYESYGKSFIISPWGSILKETILDREENISYLINLDEIRLVKKSLPILM
jgi:predicted amidohydrolase